MALKIPKPSAKITLKELFNISKDKDTTISRTPFGAPEGEEQWYIKKAVPWKGVKGLNNIKNISTKTKDGKAVLGEVLYNNLTNLIRMSKAISKEYLGDKVEGVVLVNYRGKEYVMPKKAYLMAEATGKPILKVADLPTRSTKHLKMEEAFKKVQEYIDKNAIHKVQLNEIPIEE